MLGINKIGDSKNTEPMRVGSLKKIKFVITSQSNQKTDTNKIQRNKTHITTKSVSP